jgi:replicative DNA helicase
MIADARDLAERQLLGALLLDPDVLGPAQEAGLRNDTFRTPANKLVFNAIAALDARLRPVDLLTVTGFLRDRHALESVGGAAYVAGLPSMVPTSFDPMAMAKRLNK